MKDNYQTDFGGYLQKNGCLLFSLIKIATDIADKDISRRNVQMLVDRLHLYTKAEYNHIIPAISDENDRNEPGAFVWDHAAVINETFKTLGSDKRVSYTGRIYMPWQVAKGKSNYGERGGDIIILHIQTPNTGHFRLPNWDPWEPGTKMVDLKSLRYYKLR